jgi:hypothetical protein
MPIKTFKGKLDIGNQEKIHLSTNNGLTGYKIKAFQVIGSVPGTIVSELVGKIYTTDQTGSITPTIDFSDTDLLAVAYVKESISTSGGMNQIIIFDEETINQDIFVTMHDAAGETTPANYYIELEQFKLDLNSSTYHTLKNIRSRTQ